MRTTWKKYEDGWARASLSNIFGPSKDVLLSRSDLREFARNNEVDKLIMATIVWGYPSGMRGKNFDRLLEHIEALKNLLMLAQDGPVNDWGTHFQGVEKIPGLGLSTYTKLLNFMSVRVGQFQALILDERIISVLKQCVFEELKPLRGLTTYSAVRLYPKYLELMDSLSRELRVPAENLEYFLFEFGRNMKPVPIKSAG